MAYAGLGENDQAFRCLDVAYEDKDPILRMVPWATRFAPLRSDPRFPDFLRRIRDPSIMPSS